MGSGLKGVTSGRIDCAARPWALEMMCGTQIPHWVTARLKDLICRLMLECHSQCVGEIGTQDVLLQQDSTLLDLLLQIGGGGKHDLVVRGAGDRSKGPCSFDAAYGFNDALLHVQGHLR